MYLQTTPNGEYFVKFPTAFESPLSVPKSEDKRVISFEEYIWELYTREELSIQIVWKLKSKIDLAIALPDFLITKADINNKTESMKNTGEFFAYLYKADKQERQKIVIVKEDDDYSHSIDKSKLITNIFDFQQLYNCKDSEKIKYFDWINLDKDDFWIWYSEETQDTFTATIKLDNLLKKLESSNNEVYDTLFTEFNFKYFSESLPEKLDKVKKSKI